MSADTRRGTPHDKGPLLGQQVAGSARYDPSLLFPVPRENARASLPHGVFQGFGEDIWHAYELSWLTPRGMPRMMLGTLGVPSASGNLIESKSLKLYLNSLNNHRLENDAAAAALIERDLSAVAGAAVSVTLADIDAPGFAGARLTSQSLDHLDVLVPETPDPDLITAQAGDSAVHTHLLRSLCPVTAQPDWATVIIETRGSRAEPEGLLAYLLAYRDHQEFHEQCVERIYTELMQALEPEMLSVQALYTRRGGLDICPWRCSEPCTAPTLRLNRQ
jgi:7-cyano-7-deazaguanine reductase